MTHTRALAWADQLLTGLSRSYSIRYFDDDGNAADCVIRPGETLSDCYISGPYDDLSDDRQEYIKDQLLAAIANDPNDRHLLNTESTPSAASVGLSVEELTFASEVEYQISAASHLPELIEEWRQEDQQEDLDDDQHRQEVWREVFRLSQMSVAIDRTDRQLAAAINMLCSNGIEAMDLDEAEGLISQAAATLSGY